MNDINKHYFWSCTVDGRRHAFAGHTPNEQEAIRVASQVLATHPNATCDIYSGASDAVEELQSVLDPEGYQCFLDIECSINFNGRMAARSLSLHSQNFQTQPTPVDQIPRTIFSSVLYRPKILSSDPAKKK